LRLRAELAHAADLGCDFDASLFSFSSDPSVNTLQTSSIGTNKSRRLNFSRALSKQSHQPENQIYPFYNQSAGSNADFVPLYEIMFAEMRVACGGSLKDLCGSVFVEGKRCFYCESYLHEHLQCDVASKRLSSNVGVVGHIKDASLPPRLSFSKALAKQHLQQDEELRDQLQRVDDSEAAYVSVPAITSKWVPKVSKKGWRAYINEPDKQFLQWAVYANDVEAVIDFIEGRNGAPVFDVDHPDFTKQTAIHRAAQSRCIGICKTLVDYGCDYNAHDVSGTSPVLILARDGVAELLEAFILMCK
jgi:hypothetical protein